MAQLKLLIRNKLSMYCKWMEMILEARGYVIHKYMWKYAEYNNIQTGSNK